MLNQTLPPLSHPHWSSDTSTTLLQPSSPSFRIGLFIKHPGMPAWGGGKRSRALQRPLGLDSRFKCKFRAQGQPQMLPGHGKDIFPHNMQV